jgi:hypothetical protein
MMANSDLLPAAVLQRKAVVYVRQSTQTQVQTNRESKRRQYDLVQEGRGAEVLHTSKSSTMTSGALPVAWWLGPASIAWSHGCAPAKSAPSFALTSHGWRATGATGTTCWSYAAWSRPGSSIWMASMTRSALLLGMKGSISEFELGVLKARMFEAARAKAHRGELRISVPIGYVWHRDVGLGFDPDARLQEAIRLFERFRKLGSARQVLLSLAAAFRKNT